MGVPAFPPEPGLLDAGAVKLTHSPAQPQPGDEDLIWEGS